jgi:hypothetical protein
MKIRRTLPALVLVVVSTACPALAQSSRTENTLKLDDQSVRPPATIDSIAWLAGSWVGEGLGGEVEEIWSAPSAGSMMGGFKLLQQGEVAFYELILIREVEGSLVLELKHFNSDLTGWEEKNDMVTFRLVKVDGDSVYFSGLTYRRVDEDRMHIFLAMRSQGELREVQFELRRR